MRSYIVIMCAILYCRYVYFGWFSTVFSTANLDLTSSICALTSSWAHFGWFSTVLFNWEFGWLFNCEFGWVLG